MPILISVPRQDAIDGPHDVVSLRSSRIGLLGLTVKIGLNYVVEFVDQSKSKCHPARRSDTALNLGPGLQSGYVQSCCKV